MIQRLLIAALESLTARIDARTEQILDARAQRHADEVDAEAAKTAHKETR